MAQDLQQILQEHVRLTRRYLLGLGAAGIAAIRAGTLWAEDVAGEKLLAEAIAQLTYLTPLDEFRMFGRGNPPPYKLPPEKLREVGLTKETWKLEVIPDEQSGAIVENPLSIERGNAFTWNDLMKLAEKHAVRFLRVMTCTNGNRPCGMGLWEGVPLREVIWLTRPKGNIRRVYYYGYHNNDPKQRFQSSLSINRVLEDPPGEHPVILCYKLNGKWLTPKAGAPVRLLVPDRYGNKSVKWLQRIVLTNDFKANDTYAEWNNDVDSHLKTCARFIHVPRQVKAGQPFAITGLAQVGMSGLTKVQYWLCPADTQWPADDPYFTRAAWKDADILPPPQHWGPDLPDGKLPPVPTQIDPKTGQPYQWPLRGTIVHWVALIEPLKKGEYTIRCRTIDRNGFAQPMPRPFPKSGRNSIEARSIRVV